MKKVFLLFGCFWAAGLFAQTDYARQYGNSITAAELKEHVYYLAGPECEGRETGEKGQKVAAQYLVKYFAGLGILPAVKDYLQVFPIPSHDRGCDAELSVNGTELAAGKDFVVYCGFESATVVFKQGEIIPFAGYGLGQGKKSDYDGIDVKDKWVVLLDGSSEKDSKRYDPKDIVTTAKVLNAEHNGAKGVIIVVHGDLPARMEMDDRLGMESRFNEKHIPYVYVSPEFAGKYLFGQPLDVVKSKVDGGKKKDIKCSSAALKISVGMPGEKMSGENVIAYIEGSDLKEELVIITAHYDHLGIHDGEVYYGADDDGSGTSAIMEIAEAFMEAKKNGQGPRRSVLIMPVSGEEKGLWGSEYYSENPVFPLKNTVADLNIDMIGRIDKFHNDGNYVYLIGSDKLSTQLDSVCVAANKKYVNLNLDYKFNDPNDPNQFYYRSDHYNFAKHGIPVIFFFTGVHADYHKPTDTPDKLDYDKMERITKLVFYTAWDLANSTKRIEVNVQNAFPNSR